MRTSSAGRRGSPGWRLIGAVLLMVLVVAVPVTGDSRQPATAAPGIDFRGDFETGDASQFSNLECANPRQQFGLVTAPVRQGRYAARFQTAPGDTWDNGTIRCLAARYDTNEREGDDYYYAFSVYFDSAPAYNLIWELHTRAEIYTVNQNLSVVPHALEVVDGRLEYRLLTGPAKWDGSTWTGWAHAEPDIPLTGSIPVRTWIDFVVHIRFTQSDRGLLEVWTRTGNGAWPTRPQVTRQGIPTLQWIPGTNDRVLGHLNDPRIAQAIPTSSLYAELGLYKGAAVTSTVDQVYLDGYRRGGTLAAVMAEFP
jgi:hypothetical protein